MRFLPLLWAGIWRRRMRTILIALSIVNAFVLFGILQGFAGGIGASIASTNADVLVTASRIGLRDPLPLSQLEEVRRTPGVAAAMPVILLTGTYRNPNERLQAAGVDPDLIAQVDPDLTIPKAQLEALKATRAGVLVGSDAASTLGIKVGDRLSIKSNLWANRDGTPNWPMEVVGIFKTNPQDRFFGKNMLMNIAYLDEGRLTYRSTANLILVRVANPAEASSVGARVDAQFQNSSHPTKTVSQRQMAQDQVRQIREIGTIINAVVGATFFALLFSIGAVLLQGVRERTNEFAVLKTLGFSDGLVLRLILGESLVLCTLAAGIGLGLAVLLFPTMRAMTGFEPRAGGVLALGAVAALVLALLSGLPPAVRGMRLRIVDALAGR